MSVSFVKYTVPTMVHGILVHFGTHWEITLSYRLTVTNYSNFYFQCVVIPIYISVMLKCKKIYTHIQWMFSVSRVQSGVCLHLRPV